MTTFASDRSGTTTLSTLHSAWRLRFRPLELLDSLPDKGKVVRFKIGRHQVYMLTDPTMVRELLVSQGKNAPKAGVMFDNARAFLGNGLITSNGTFHLRQRRLLQPAFQPGAVAGYAGIMSQAITERTESWRDGQTLAMQDELFQLTQTVASRCLFSVDPTGHMVDEISEWVPVLEKGVGRRTLLPIDLLYRLPTPGNRRYQTAVRRLDWLISQIIRSYRESGANHGDLLSMLVAARDETTGEPMSDRQIHEECLSLFIASVETTARAMSWVLYLLGNHPDVEAGVHAEVDEVLCGRAAKHEDIARLPYLRQVVTETLRLYPPAWLLPRKAAVDIDLDGYRIPAGSEIFTSPYLVHRDEKVYPEPAKFDPDRWAPERARLIPRESYLPFGAGARQCIGNTFAFTEIMLWLGTLAGRWRMRPAPGRKVRVRAMTVLYPDPLPMIASRRAAGRPR